MPQGYGAYGARTQSYQEYIKDHDYYEKTKQLKGRRQTPKQMAESIRKQNSRFERNKPLYNDLKENGNWQKKIKENNANLERRLQDIQKRKDAGEYQFHQKQWEDDYYGSFRENERKNAKAKREYPSEKYQYVDSYATYKDKRDKIAGKSTSNDGEIQYDYDKKWSGKEYTNDEFMEHLTDSNWHTERKMLEDAGLTNEQMSYVKDNTSLSLWSVDLDKAKTEQLIKEAKEKYPKYSPKHNGVNKFIGNDKKYSTETQEQLDKADTLRNINTGEIYDKVGNGQYRSRKDGYDYYIDTNVANRDNPQFETYSDENVVDVPGFKNYKYNRKTDEVHYVGPANPNLSKEIHYAGEELYSDDPNRFGNKMKAINNFNKSEEEASAKRVQERYEYELYKKAKEQPDSIDAMTENSTDWEELDRKYKNKYDMEKYQQEMLNNDEYLQANNPNAYLNKMIEDHKKKKSTRLPKSPKKNKK